MLCGANVLLLIPYVVLLLLPLSFLLGVGAPSLSHSGIIIVKSCSAGGFFMFNYIHINNKAVLLVVAQLSTILLYTTGCFGLRRVGACACVSALAPLNCTSQAALVGLLRRS